MHRGSIRQITGPGAIDLEGEMAYAINFSADDPVRILRGVRFLPDTQAIPGAKLVGPQQVTPWQNRPEFGSSVDAQVLEELCQDIRWANSGGGERLRASLAVRPGEEYQLQILISANTSEDRRWDIRIDGAPAVDEITSLGASPGQSYSAGRATLYTARVLASSDVLVIEMGNLFGQNDGGDRNPIWQALTLERLFIPPTPEDVRLTSDQFFPTQTSPVGRFEVQDRKLGASHELNLVAGAGDEDNAKFVTRGTDLHLGDFDFRSVPAGTSFAIRVRATDTADATRWLERTFRVTVAAPHPPSGLRLDATSISDLAVPGATVALLEAVDADAFDVHRFALVPGAGDQDNALFRIADHRLELARSPAPGQPEARLRLGTVDQSGLTYETPVVLPWVAPQVRINEILASQVSGVSDEADQPQEWIEIANELAQHVDLTGWRLTDDLKAPDKWTFPSQAILPGGFVVVLADGRGSSPAGSTNLHASFSLDAAGESVALLKPGGTRPASTLEFPEQFPGVAYGVGHQGGTGYLPTPTPGATNGMRAVAGRNVVTFSRARGFYDAAFDLELDATLPASTIRYTVDGTVPTATTGSAYTGPIRVTPNTSSAIRGTRVVRAIALHPEAAYAPISTHTYLFVTGAVDRAVDALVNQSRLVTSITRHATYGPLLPDAFRALPAVSVLLPQGPTTRERRGSVELFDPGQREPGFQIDCGIAATGTSSLGSPKLSMAARFRVEYGASRLRYPVFAQGSMFPERAADSFKELRLRSHSHDTFYWLGTREFPPTPYGTPSVNRNGDAQLVRNLWMDEMQLKMGQPGKHGRQVHLFLNGSYHGIYHLHEHADEDFMASYFPGVADDYHSTGATLGGSDHGDGDTWDKVWSRLKGSVGNYADARRWIDVTNLCDYLVLSFYAGNDWDWTAQHNWSAAGPRLPDQGGWKFFQQDSDISLQDAGADCTDQDVPDGLFNALMRHADFRALFRDRVVRHCFRDGALTPGPAAALYDARMNELRLAIIAETARWQPSSSVAALPWDRDQEWTTEWNYFRQTFFPQRTTRFLLQLRRHSGWWPADPPTLSLPPGRVPAGSAISFSTLTRTVYFTTDGSDPRLPGGGINPRARSSTSSVVQDSVAIIDQPTVLRARAYTGTDWSGLVDAYYVPEGIAPASVLNLVISEIHYHPLDNAETEFVELLNTSAAPLDLSGVRLAGAVDFAFPPAVFLRAGERQVVCKNLAAFDARYLAANSPYFRGEFSRVGPWEGSLSNGGETLEVLDQDGRRILACVYGTTASWPRRADGGGSSLELIGDETVPSGAEARSGWIGDGRHWRASADVHGSPGFRGTTTPPSVVFNEILATPRAGDTDVIELLNRSDAFVDLGGWMLSDSAGNYRKYRFPEPTRVPAGGRWVLREDDFANPANPASLVAFGLNGDGDQLHLVRANPRGDLLRFEDEVRYAALPVGTSIGRFPDGTGPWVWLQTATWGTENSRPVPGYEAWAKATLTGATGVESLSPEADDDLDGVANFSRYAFVLEPGSAEPSPLRLHPASAGSGDLEIEQRTRTGAADVAYRFEVSNDLARWLTLPDGFLVLSQIPQPDGATLIRLRLRPNPAIPAPASPPPLPYFLRVRAEPK